MPKRNANISTATPTVARVATVSRCLSLKDTRVKRTTLHPGPQKKKRKKNRSKTRFERQRAALKSVWWFPATTAGNHATWRRRHPVQPLAPPCTSAVTLLELFPQAPQPGNPNHIGHFVAGHRVALNPFAGSVCRLPR